MVSFVTNYVQNTAMGLLSTGITAAGTMAGNAVGGVGGLIENGGRSVGEGVNGGIRSFGDTINAYGDSIKASMAPTGAVNTAQKTAVSKVGGATQQKPPSVQKALPSSGAAPKALPPAGGKLKALPAPPAKGLSAPKSLPSAKSPVGVPGKGALPIGAKGGVSSPSVGKPKPGVAATPVAGSGIPARTPVKTPYKAPEPVKKPQYPIGQKSISAASRPKPAAAVGAVRGVGNGAAGAAKGAAKGAANGGYDFMKAAPGAATKKVEAPKGKMASQSFF